MGAQTAATLAEVPLRGAQTEATQAEVPMRAAQVPNVEAQTRQHQAGAYKSETETAILQAKLDALRQAETDLSQGATTLDKVLDDAQITDPQRRTIAKQAYATEPDPLKKGQTFTKAIETMTGSDRAAATRANIPQNTTEPQLKAASSASEMAYSAKQFLDSFDAGGFKDMGTLSGGPMKAMLERWGVATGDVNLVQMWNASMQLTADSAKSRGGFGGEWAVRLGRDVTPGIRETPLHAIAAMGEVAGRVKASLETRLAGAVPSQRAPIEKALDEVKEVYDRAHSMRAYVAHPADRPNEDKTVVLYNGNQVDARTFKPIVEGRTDYQFKGGAYLPGATVIERAEKAGMSPEAYLAYIRTYYDKGQ